MQSEKSANCEELLNFNITNKIISKKDNNAKIWKFIGPSDNQKNAKNFTYRELNIEYCYSGEIDENDKCTFQYILLRTISSSI